MPPSYAKIPARALSDERLTGTDIRVLAAIGLHVDARGLNCFASSRRLSTEAGVSRNQFFASTKRLIETGMIARSSGQAAGKGSNYRVIFEQEGGVPESGTGGVPNNGTGGVPNNGTGGGPESGTRESRIPVPRSPRNRDGSTINSPWNISSNNPTAARGTGGKLKAAELLKNVRSRRSAQFPGSLAPEWQADFSSEEQRVVRAVGIERILTTPPANDGPLLAQVAEMLTEATSALRSAG